MERLESFRIDLVHFLRRKLQNDLVNIRAELIEAAPTEKKLYTQQEKLEFLVDKFPAIKALKEKLGLDLEG